MSIIFFYNRYTYFLSFKLLNLLINSIQSSLDLKCIFSNEKKNGMTILYFTLFLKIVSKE